MNEEFQRRAGEYRRILRDCPPLYRAVRAVPAPPEDVQAVVATHVLAPALGGFVRWLLDRAAAGGKKRLYFLARDGYFPYQAAGILGERRRPPMEYRYLCCSRLSLRLPLFHLDREAALESVCRGGMEVTPDRILARAGLTQEERTRVLPLLRLPFGREEPIPRAALAQVRRALRACDPFLACMDRHSRAALPGLAGYLRQEGLLDGIPDAVVDSGWVGSMQKTLGDALARLGRTQPPEGYYWGLYSLPAGADRPAYHPYYFSPEGPLRRKVYFNNNLFEAVFSAPHGMTLGYGREGDAFVPRFGPVNAGNAAFARRIEPWLLEPVRRLAEEPGKPDVGRERETVYRLLRLFMAAPTPAEVRAFGALGFSDDVTAGEDGALAAPLTERELADLHPLGRLRAAGRGETLRESAWYEGSAVRGGRHVRRHLRQHALYQALRFLRQGRGARKTRQEATPL